ncbi:hypothetical protein LTR17_018922 [Elasticomyces elasticus]|nr:hypothetical protein LTR17_018922 [Elasticomyces elasticus]
MEYRTPDYDPKPNGRRGPVAWDDAWLVRDDWRRLAALKASRQQFVENRRVESDINSRYASDDPKPYPRWEPLAYDAWFDRDTQRRLAARRASNKQVAENRLIMDYRVPDDDPRPSALRNPSAYRAWLDRDDQRIIAFEDSNAERGNIENRRVESDTNSASSVHDPEPSALRDPSAFRAWLDRDIERKTVALVAAKEQLAAEIRRAENGRNINARQSTYTANRHKPSQSLKVSKRPLPRQANVHRPSMQLATRKMAVERPVPLTHSPNVHAENATSGHLALQQQCRGNAKVEKDTSREEVKQTDLMLPVLSDGFVSKTTVYASAAEFEAAEPSKYVEAQKSVLDEAMTLGGGRGKEVSDWIIRRPGWRKTLLALTLEG